MVFSRLKVTYDSLPSNNITIVPGGFDRKFEKEPSYIMKIQKNILSTYVSCLLFCTVQRMRTIFSSHEPPKLDGFCFFDFKFKVLANQSSWFPLGLTSLADVCTRTTRYLVCFRSTPLWNTQNPCSIGYCSLNSYSELYFLRVAVDEIERTTENMNRRSITTYSHPCWEPILRYQH